MVSPTVMIVSPIVLKRTPSNELIVYPYSADGIPHITEQNTLHSTDGIPHSNDRIPHSTEENTL